MNPSEVLEERISDISLKRTYNPAQLNAIFELARIATSTVLRAAAGGNVHCRTALNELEPHLSCLSTK